MTRARVNIRAVANTAAMRREKLNGRDVIIVPSATLPDDIVMNGIRYPAEEIERSYKTLERTPAPLGHPTINGKFVSASDPEGINIGWVGAWNANVRRENGRVFIDKVIDVERASQSPDGKRLLNAIEKKEPIHTSTGLYCNLEAANGEVDYKSIARDIGFDHDAILLDEEGAATPENGVGIFVNSAGAEEEIPVINSVFEDADRDMDWALQSLASAIERRNRAGVLDQLKSLIIDAYDRLKGSEKGKPQSQKEDDMSVSKEQFDALSATVNTLKETVESQAKGIGETIANAIAAAVKPLTDAHAEAVANAKAKDEAEADDLAAKVVKANLLTEDVAKATPLNALRELAKIAEPKDAAAIAAGGDAKANGKDDFDGYDINALMEVK